MALIVVMVLVASTLAGWAVTVPLHRFCEDDAGEGFAVTCVAACERCGAEVRPVDVAPLRSWFGPGRRCSHCGASRGWSWVAPQAAIPMLAVITTLAIGPTASVPVYGLFVVVLVVASVIDLRTMLIPRQVVWVGMAGGLALMGGVSLWTGDTGRLSGAVVGAVGYFAFLWVTSLISPGGMGMGDVRLGALIGLYLGWLAWPLIAAALVLGSVVGIAQGLFATGLSGRRQPFPFGPALAAGALMTVWAHQPILDLLVGSAGP